MAIEIRETKITPKFKVGDICMLQDSITFTVAEGNKCEVPFGSVVEIRKVCADCDVEYYAKDCNGKEIPRPIGEYKLCLATEENFEKELKEVECYEKIWRKKAKKCFAVFSVCSIFIFILGLWGGGFWTVCCSVLAVVIMGGALVILYDDFNTPNYWYEETKEKVNRAREELNHWKKI